MKPVLRAVLTIAVLSILSGHLPLHALAADFTEQTTSIDFIKVEGSTYQMGDTTGLGRLNERPVQTVKVPTFLISQHEITVGQFGQFVEATGYQTDAEKTGWVLDIDAAMGSFTKREGISWKNPGFNQTPEHPVVWVNWNDAVAFTKWLSGQSGTRFALPSESQWELAAKGPEGSRWSGSADPGNVGDIAWFSGNSGGQTHAVATRAPNSLGVFDMSGNVWEWCNDTYSLYGGKPTPGKKADVGENGLRTIRGGSWRVGTGLVTTTYRNGYKTTYAHSSIGFRIVKYSAD